jgi:hypothetical protein
MQRIRASWQLLGVLVLALLAFQGCGALNPLCGSARPAPVLGSLSPATITFAETQQGFLLTLNGSHFVSSSVVVINGTTLNTANVTVNTPSGTSGDLGCSSGGTSHTVLLTIT